MPGRKRTAKSLGTRHDMNYFKQRTAFRKWRLWTAIALPVLALVWMGAEGVRGHQAIYSSGPLSRAHAFFGNNCATCHISFVNGVKKTGFSKHVSDQACLGCHEAPAHQDNQTFTPECGTCHVEHTGMPLLAHTSASSCAQCHGDLKTTSGELKYVAHITSFNRNHPEFAALRTPKSDPGHIEFNHYAHLNQPVMDLQGTHVQLECADCHRTGLDVLQPWKHGDGRLQQTISKQQMDDMARNPDEGRQLMAVITYENQCAGCHTLQFDKRFTEQVPHPGGRDQKDLQQVRDFLQAKFRDYIAKNPGAIREVALTNQDEDSRRRGASSAPPAPSFRNASEWVDYNVKQAEDLLWNKTCKQCHQLDFPNGPEGLPTIKPAGFVTRWLPHASFNHQSHRAIDCASCHSAAPVSREAADVLVPGIKTCQTCHNGNPASYGHAENGCFECHSYHNWQNAKGFKGKYAIPDLVTMLEKRNVLPDFWSKN